MTDRELLELAAKAAGIDWQSYHYSRGLCLATPRAGMVITQMWNPLSNDGDALRLAVKLDVLWKVDRHYTKYLDVTDTDYYAATRRAIVRTAAEIGKSMK